MFTFSLQSVLDVRERLQKLKYREFSEVLMHRQKLTDAITERKEALVKAAANAQATALGSPSTAPMQLLGSFKQRLTQEMELLAEHVRETNQLLEAKRQELVEARRAHRSLEILKEKEQQRFKQEQARLERIAEDEAATNHYVFHQGI